MNHSFGTNEISGFFIATVVAVFVLLLLALVILILQVRRIRKETSVEKMTDAETGMGNLLYFKRNFSHTISDGTRSLYYIAYVVLDISYLRSYHNEYSLDQLLNLMASVLAEHTGENEFAGRITENGFAIAYREGDDENAQRRIEQIVGKLNEFTGIRGKSKTLVFHAAIYHLCSADKNCEILLFNLRKNCNRLFGTEKQIILCDVHSMNAIQETKKNTDNILKGIENNEFKLYLQFIVDNKTKKIISAEALSRWDNPSKGLLLPGSYIEAMEQSGLISKLDFYMFDLVCRQLEAWRGTELENLCISCNFTRITLSEPDFIEKIRAIADKYNFDRSKLAIEITEDAMEKNRKTATDNVALCKQEGFLVYLDDLGSGYTSLVNLCDYPIDVVKLDRDILLKTETQRGKDLFDGIIALAHSLGIKIICEGVETENQASLVYKSACDYIQGWFYSKPIPLCECDGFVKAYSLNS